MRPHISDKILDWYDKNARILPWRVSPQERKNGVIPNPYFIWLSEVMLQQTTVASVIGYYEKFITRWPSIHDLASASLEQVLQEWAGLGYYSRARNLHKTAQVIAFDYQGIFPEYHQQLVKLAGIGAYTSASISAIAFDHPAPVMDGNIERVLSRLFCTETPLPYAKKELYEKAAELTPQKRAGDYAQAMMDLGATICTPKKPLCLLCPIQRECLAFKAGTVLEYPKKIKKSDKPSYDGVILLITDTHKQSLVIEKRPPTGLFAEMYIFPYLNPHEKPELRIHNNISIEVLHTELENILTDTRSVTLEKIGHVKHVFTHFNFHADIMLITLPAPQLNSGRHQRIDIKNLKEFSLPKLMLKALAFL